MPHRRYKNSSRSPRSTLCAGGKRPVLRRQAGHWAGGPSWEGCRPVPQPGPPSLPGLLPLRAVPQDVDLTWTSSPCAAPQWGCAELVRVRWPDTPAAVHRAQARRPRGTDFSSFVEATRSATRQAGPSAPSPCPPKVIGHRASSWRSSGSGCCRHVVLDLAEGLLNKVQRVLLPRDVRAPATLARAPPRGGPTGPVRGWRPPDSQMAWVKTWVTLGRLATRASQSSRSYRVCITGKTR